MLTDPLIVSPSEPCEVVGLISGTSVDGIDAAWVTVMPPPEPSPSGSPQPSQLQPSQVVLRAALTYPYPEELRARILKAIANEPLTAAEFSQLDRAIATAFGEAALALGAELGAIPDLIGSHGQTVYHEPPQYSSHDPAGQVQTELDQAELDQAEQNDPTKPAPKQVLRLGHSWQLGRGDLIAFHTGVPTVSNFRAADIAQGGHGAPLVPLTDALLWRHPSLHRCLQNIGGIGNVTYLPPYPDSLILDQETLDQEILGWDTGPGNALIDLAVQQWTQGAQTYDAGGQWAAQGQPHQALVDRWLQDPFLAVSPPKSTGREYFSTDYLQRCLQDCQEAGLLSQVDILATLTEFTARAIATSYQQFLPHPPAEVWVSGGGSHNAYLMSRLAHWLHPIPVSPITELGMDPDYKEAMAFAMLAYLRLKAIPAGQPSVTGSVRPTILGELHVPFSWHHGSTNRKA